jgi:hypothetical protein
VRSEVSEADSVKVITFLDETPLRFVDGHQSFGGISYLCLQLKDGMFIPTYRTTWDDIFEDHNLNIKIKLREIVTNYIDRDASRIFVTSSFAVNRF